jgi:pimeloyl-ACP methyl ester carboxylesterase
MPVPHETGRARSGELNIFYRKLGTPGRTPILIVHGLSYFSYDWLPIAQALGAERQVAAMDMRGFGDSDWSAVKDYSVPAMAADILNVLDHLRWKGALLIGHSMGGRSTTYVAAKHPGRVAGLALIDYSPDNAPAGSQRVSRTVAGVPERFSSIDEALTHFKQTDRERLREYLKAVPGGYAIKRDTYFRDQFRRLIDTGERPKLGVDMWALIAEVRCPVLSMRGSRSDMYAAETVAKMLAANARIALAEVDAGHNIAGENPTGFMAAIRPFLATLEKAHEYERH